jgi:hypothetical protein
VYREFTVAGVRGSAEVDHVEVLFLESARIYRLEKTRPDFDELIGRLREGERVRIALAPPDGSAIRDVKPAAAGS